MNNTMFICLCRNTYKYIITTYTSLVLCVESLMFDLVHSFNTNSDIQIKSKLLLRFLSTKYMISVYLNKLQ